MGRRSVEEIRPPVEQPDVDEPRYRIERALPASGRERRWQEIVDVRPESVERQNPSGRRKLRHPDDVELQDVWRRHAGVEPLHVELMPLIRGIWRGPKHNRKRWVLSLESIELSADHVAFTSDEAPGKREDAFGRAAAVD